MVRMGGPSVSDGRFSLGRLSGNRGKDDDSDWMVQARQLCRQAKLQAQQQKTLLGGSAFAPDFAPAATDLGRTGASSKGCNEERVCNQGKRSLLYRPSSSLERSLIVVREMMASLGDFERGFDRLSLELSYIDAGDAERLRITARRLKEEVCLTKKASSSFLEGVNVLIESWLERLSAPNTSVELQPSGLSQKGCKAFLSEPVKYHNDAQSVAEPHAITAMEVADTHQVASVLSLLAAAMLPLSHVDFPCITDICQRLADFPSEIPDAVSSLVATLMSRADGQSISLGVFQQRSLKALTILNEMLYDEVVLAELASRRDAHAVFKDLKRCRPVNGSFSSTAEEAIQMLASEVDRRLSAFSDQEARTPVCFVGSICRSLSSKFRKDESLCAVLLAPSSQRIAATPAVSTFKLARTKFRAMGSLGVHSPCAVWNGDGEGQYRGRAGARSLAQRLRRSHSTRPLRHRTSLAVPVLEDITLTFANFASELAKLYEELDCLDAHITDSSDLHAAQPLAFFLRGLATRIYAACEVQARALALQEQISTDGAQDFVLASFLEEALAASDELGGERRRLAVVCKAAGDRAKAMMGM